MKYKVLLESNIPIGRQDGQTGNKYKAITLALCSSSSGSRLYDVGTLIDRETRLLIIRDRFEPMHVGVKWLPGTKGEAIVLSDIFLRRKGSVDELRI